MSSSALESPSIEIAERYSLPVLVSSIVWTTQLVASLLTLALPPFYALFVPRVFPGTPTWFAGLIFAAPLAAGAWMAPVWGKLADRFGRLPMTIRAHLGLAFALFWAGSARNGWEFLIALTLQGALGGTYSASRAILLERVPPSARAQALETLETAPRTALVVGPLIASLVGIALLTPSIFLYLAPLPIGCAALLLLLHGEPTALFPLEKNHAPSDRKSSSQEFKLTKFALFALFWGGGILAPYSIAWTLERVPGLPVTVATVFALLPNIVFSASGFFPRSTRAIVRGRLGAGLAAQALTMILLCFCSHWASQLVARLVYSFIFVLNWREIHDRVVRSIPDSELGRKTGELDAIQRWAALSGGVLAALFWWALPSPLALPACAGLSAIAVIGLFSVLERKKHARAS